MKITVIGTGYVGLVTGACFAEMGNLVTCVDVDEQKVQQLNAGHIPIYEPGLETMVAGNVKDERLSFTKDLAVAMKGAKAIFIAVGTPQGEDGSADLQYMLAAARHIGEHLNHYTVVANKSTVPVGTADKVKAEISAALAERKVDVQFDVVSNPEFLKEGSAVKDFMSPDRIIVGADSEPARELMRDLYRTFMRTHDRLMFMGVRDAELTKYAANAMLATKISFINEIANIAERVGADIEQVRLGIGADQRIGHHFIYPGCGYGGSCFPKDVKALVRIAEENNFDPVLLNAVETRNSRQKTMLFEKLNQIFDGNLQKKVIAIWGLAFKPNTDDVREAPSLVLIRQLLSAGATVRAHDPVAVAAAKCELASDGLASSVNFFNNQYDVLAGADAMVLVTEWRQYRSPDFELIMKMMNAPLIIDGRNVYSSVELGLMGINHIGFGKFSNNKLI